MTERSHAPSALWAQPLEADHRTLAALRVALALVLLVDLLGRAPEMLLHYSDLGVVSAHFAIAAKLQALQPTYLFAIRWPYLVTGFFAFTAACYIALALGWRTRLATFFALLCTLSIHGRNFMVGHAGDALSHALLAWGLLLPLGARWSIDAWMREHPCAGVPLTAQQWRERSHPRVRSLAVLGLRVEVAAFFILNGLSKTGSAWNEGTAWHHILWLDSMARIPAVWARELIPAGVLALASQLHPWIEILGGLALLLPFAWPRRAGVAACGLLWASSGLLVQQGSLVPLALVSLLIFLRASDFDALAARLGQHSPIGRWLMPRPPRTDAPSEHPIEVAAARVRELVAGAFLLAALSSMSARNPALPGWLSLREAPKWTHTFNEPLMLAHAWGAFAPEPPRVDGRFVLIGRTRSGAWVEVLKGGAPPEGMETAMGSARSMQDLAFDLRLRLGWLETMKSELARYCWNAHLLASSRVAEPIVECRGLVFDRANPPPGQRERASADLEPARVVFAAQHHELLEPETPPSEG